MKNILKMATLGLVLVVFMTASRLWAQESEPIGLDTITVTAEKKDADVQKVPISMNAFNSMDLEDAGIESTPEVTRYIPNVYFKEATMENIIVVRGVSSVDGATVSPTGVYVDDINYPLLFMHNLQLLNVERVELLRGPQGTLYGRNTESGVLNIITKQPGNTLKGSVKGSYSFYDTSHGFIPKYQLNGNIDVPIVEDKLFLGVAGVGIMSDGFMKNVRLDKDDAAEIDRSSFRACARWLPTERLEMSLIADASDFSDKQGLYRVFTSQGGLKNNTNTETSGFYESNLDQKNSGQVLKAKYLGEIFDFVSITGRRDYNNSSTLGSGVGLVDYGRNDWEYDDQFLSQEFRISSKDNSGPLEWLLGLYGFKEETDIYFSKFEAFQIRDTQVDKMGAAAFLNMTYSFLKRFHLTGGLRYDFINLEGHQDLKGSDWSGNDISASYKRDRDFHQWLPKLALAYDMNENSMVYGSVAKGYLEGGYNYAQATDSASFVYDPEYTLNYEIGFKTSWLDKRLIANVALFYITINDKQVSEYTAGGAVASIDNAVEAHSKGIELELKAKPAKGLDIFATFGYVDTEIDEWKAGSADYTGNKMPNTPEYTYNLGVQYSHDKGLFFRADLLGTGEMYGDVKNSNHVKLEDYYLLNLRLGYVSENYDVIFWCKNTFDETYYTSAFDYGDPNEAIGVAQNGEPRSIGVTLTYRF
ncbi:TonB-dependent receptor [Dethiosulfatarculus sandiegensis]|uniref:TonB-denpendent receptor n=1 Tax=Dethiosulfatarculus sandiegensis TaxID=1429043 RepID=A0A0D2IY56_9BACT|nr:TonB-dependent receptor [Dethiosulfatarculus sandiegensis]KIX10959.1 hypothetical protein X474_26500 [Dethiosulfatarculus sandiegensis]